MYYAIRLEPGRGLRLQSVQAQRLGHSSLGRCPKYPGDTCHHDAVACAPGASVQGTDLSCYSVPQCRPKDLRPALLLANAFSLFPSNLTLCYMPLRLLLRRLCLNHLLAESSGESSPQLPSRLLSAPAPGAPMTHEPAIRTPNGLAPGVCCPPRSVLQASPPPCTPSREAVEQPM